MNEIKKERGHTPIYIYKPTCNLRKEDRKLME